MSQKNEYETKIPDKQNISGLIIEGISGTGKTTVLKHILNSNHYLKKPYLSSIVLSEYQTQRILEKKAREGSLTKEDNIALLHSHVLYQETLTKRLNKTEWCRENQTEHKVSFIFERFHLTHVIDYHHIDWEDVEKIDSRLFNLNAKLCILTATPEQLNQRLFETRDKQWNNYIKRFGSTRKTILGHFLSQQKKLLSLAEKSSLPLLIFNPTGTPPEDYVREILFGELNNPNQI